MIRLLFLLFIACRVIACPVCCAGGDVYMGGVGTASHSCSCVHEVGTSCDDGRNSEPIKSPCPCETGCECQITGETGHRVAVDVQWMVDFAPLCLDTLDLSDALVVRFEEQPRRLDLPTGRSVRLAHASLLI